MHLAGPALTTTSYKKRPEKITKAKQAELEQGWRERNQRLKQMGLPKETFEQYKEWVYGRGKKTKTETNNRPVRKVPITTANKIPASTSSQFTHDGNKAGGVFGNADTKGNVVPRCISDWTKGTCSSKPSPTYTGSAMIGIGTMHKSNTVPIFSTDEAKNIATMRR